MIASVQSLIVLKVPKTSLIRPQCNLNQGDGLILMLQVTNGSKLP